MRLLYLGLLLSITVVCKAQSSYRFGVLPSFNINKSLKKDWKLNLKVESRQLLKEGIFKEKTNFNYAYILTDLSIITAKKIGANKSLAVGYLTRMKEDEIVNRSIQQFVITRQYSSFRSAHRISTDQTFTKGERTEFRLRYRLSLEFPLKGQSVNPKEFYLKMNNEYLNSLEGKDYDFEIRLVPLIGYEFSDKNKLECGMDYRVNFFLNDSPESRFWMSINWYVAIC